MTLPVALSTCLVAQVTYKSTKMASFEGAEEFTMSAPTAVFGDEIFTATDLNRRAGHVPDEAANRPVTITRNDEAFALLNRKDASRMVEAASNARRMVDLVTAISTYGLGKAQVPIGHPFEWLNAFDIDEIRTLLAETWRFVARRMPRSRGTALKPCSMNGMRAP